MRKTLVKIDLLILLILTLFKSSTAQENQVFAGTQFPLFYSLGYEEKIVKNLNLGIQLGWLDKPFDYILIKEAKRRDLDNELGSIIQQHFNIGYNGQVFLKYRLNHFHFGLSFSKVFLKATDLPYQQLADIYDIDLSSYSSFIDITTLLRNIELASSLYLPGIFIGKEFKFKNPHFLVGTEFGFQKIISSSSSLTYGNGNSVPVVSDLVNKDLKKYYKEEGNLPTFNFYFIYRFNKSINGMFQKSSKNKTDK